MDEAGGLSTLVTSLDGNTENKEATEQSKEKKKTEEVSQILTTFSDSVADFSSTSKSTNMKPDTTDGVLSVQTDDLLGTDDQGCHDNSSPPLSSSSSDDEVCYSLYFSLSLPLYIYIHTDI